MYAIIRSGGKQYKVEEGSVLRLEKLNAREGTKIKFDEVLMLKTDDKTHIGSPYVKGAILEATVLSTEKDKKVIVFKYKRRKQYRRKRGHRQQHSKIRIEKISFAPLTK